MALTLEERADAAAAAIREKALNDAIQVCSIWMETMPDLRKSTNPQIALVIAEVTRVTARKIKEAIFALLGEPEPPKPEPRWIERTCDCDWSPNNAPGGCAQGKSDGKCTIWMRV